MMGIGHNLANEKTGKLLDYTKKSVTGEYPQSDWIQPYLNSILPDNQAGDFITGMLTKRHSTHLRQRQIDARADLERQQRCLDRTEHAFDLSVTSYNPSTSDASEKSLEERVGPGASLHHINESPDISSDEHPYQIQDVALHRTNQAFFLGMVSTSDISSMIASIGVAATGFQKGNTARRFGKGARKTEQKAKELKTELSQRLRSIQAASEFYLDGALFLGSDYDARDNTVRFDSPPQPYIER